jgi:phosphotriesterase-related protein
LHTSRYYGDHEWTRTESPDELATRFIAEIESGIDAHDYRGDLVERTEHRAGMLKVATIGEEPSEAEARLFEAAAIAHTATGVPILTHCEAGRGAIQQIEMFAALGVDLSRVALSHTDKVADRSYHRDLLDTGVNIAYDQALRQVDQDTVATAGLIADMITAGHEHQILLGTDGARRSLWRTLGGSPGLAWILTGLPKELSSRGIESRAIARLLVDNPARYLAFA